MKTTDNSKSIRSETQSENQNKEDFGIRTTKEKKKTETLLIKLSRASSYAYVTRRLKENIDVNTLKVNIKTMKKI